MASLRLAFSTTILASAAATAIAGTLLSPDAYARINPAMRFAVPDFAHWLGRDELGRDTFSRLIAGATWTLGQALAAAALALVAGWLLHRLSHRSERVVIILARVLFIAPKLLFWSPLGHIVLAVLGALSMLPGFLAVIAVIAWLGPGPERTIASLGTMFAVAAAYLLAMVQPSLPRLGLLLFGWIIVSASALDAIGLGLQPPRPSWGVMVGGLHGPLSLSVVLAGACIVLVSAAAIMAADALRPAAATK